MKKNIKIVIVLLITLITIYFGIYFIQTKTLTNSFSKETNTKFDYDTQFVRCDINIFKPEFAFVYGSIGFYNSKNLFYQTEKEWNNNRIGGTTIKNTTFPELLRIVKQDCEQFQKDNDQINSISWRYTNADTKEKINERKERERLDKIEFEKMLKERGITLEEYKIEQEKENERLKEIRKEIDKEYGFE